MTYEKIIEKNDNIKRLKEELIVAKRNTYHSIQLMPIYFSMPFIAVLQTLFMIGVLSNHELFILFFTTPLIYLKFLIYVRPNFSPKERKYEFFFFFFFLVICFLSYVFSAGLLLVGLIVTVLFQASISFDGNFKFSEQFVFSMKDIRKISNRFKNNVNLKELEVEDSIKEIKRLLPKNEKGIEKLFSDLNSTSSENLEFIYKNYLDSDLKETNKREASKESVKSLFCENKTGKRTVTV